MDIFFKNIGHKVHKRCIVDKCSWLERRLWRPPNNQLRVVLETLSARYIVAWEIWQCILRSSRGLSAGDWVEMQICKICTDPTLAKGIFVRACCWSLTFVRNAFLILYMDRRVKASAMNAADVRKEAGAYTRCHIMQKGVQKTNRRPTCPISENWKSSAANCVRGSMSSNVTGTPNERPTNGSPISKAKSPEETKVRSRKRSTLQQITYRTIASSSSKRDRLLYCWDTRVYARRTSIHNGFWRTYISL